MTDSGIWHHMQCVVAASSFNTQIWKEWNSGSSCLDLLSWLLPTQNYLLFWIIWSVCTDVHCCALSSSRTHFLYYSVVLLGMTNAEVLHQVEHGYRMLCPSGCPRALYEIMLECWAKDEMERPTFETLQWKLEEFFVLPTSEYSESTMAVRWLHSMPCKRLFAPLTLPCVT